MGPGAADRFRPASALDSAAVQYSSAKVFGARRPPNALSCPRSHRSALARSAPGGVQRRRLRRRIGRHRTSRAPGVRAAALSGARLHLDPRVLGLGRRPVLLGARDLGAGAGGGVPLDAGILGWSDGSYLWHAGYWGPHVGFYGGINYGFGYFGRGFEGGYWRGNEFYYNRSVTNINVTNITNVYNHTVVNEPGVSRVSFHGGAGGVAVRPTAAEIAVEHERHIGVTALQRQHEQMARSDTSLRASVNGGRPAIAATPRPAVFSGHGVIAARGASPAGQRTDRPRQTQRPAPAERRGRPPLERPPPAPP